MDSISHSANQSPLKQTQQQPKQQVETPKHTTSSRILNEDIGKPIRPPTHSNRGLDAHSDICYPYEFEGTTTTTTTNQMMETGRSDRTMATTTTGHLRSAPVQSSQPTTQPPSQTTPKTPQTTTVALLPVLLSETEESRAYSVLNHRFTVDKHFKLLKGLGVGAYGVVW
jgi:hypothetical protein